MPGASGRPLGCNVIKAADWVIDLGPEGGVKGGEIVAVGTPEDVAKEPRSFTGQYLKGLLGVKASKVDAKIGATG
jgi:excinuclease ABC subunit A